MVSSDKEGKAMDERHPSSDGQLCRWCGRDATVTVGYRLGGEVVAYVFTCADDEQREVDAVTAMFQQPDIAALFQQRDIAASIDDEAVMALFRQQRLAAKAAMN